MPNKLQSTSAQIDRLVERLIERVLPIEGGKLAMRHFQDNFHKGGFVNGGLQPWQKSKRLEGGGAASQHGTLMSPNKVLYGGIKYSPSVGRVTLSNPEQLRHIERKPLGATKDLNNASDAANVAKKRARGVVAYNYYELEWSGRIWIVGFEEIRDGYEQPYFVTQKK